MLSRSWARIAIGVVVLVLIMLGSGLAAGREIVRETHRHVVVEVFNVNSDVQIFVNCRQVASLERGELGGTFDLGWLESDDLIFLSATSRDRSPSFGFAVFANGEEIFRRSRGDVEVLGFRAEEDAVVFADALSPGGTEFRGIGCQPAVIVSLPDYVQSPNDDEVPRVRGNEPPYVPPGESLDRIDSAGSWSLIPLAVLGVAMTIALEPTRRLARSHWKWVSGILAFATTVASLFLGVLGVGALVATMTLGGTLLLFAVALLLLLPPLWRSLERGDDDAELS